MLFNRFAVTALREARNLTKAEFATAAEVSAAYVTQLEKDVRSNPTVATLRKMADALEVDVRALFVQPTVDVLVAELIDRLKGDRYAIEDAVKALNREAARCHGDRVAP